MTCRGVDSALNLHEINVLQLGSQARNRHGIRYVEGIALVVIYTHIATYIVGISPRKGSIDVVARNLIYGGARLQTSTIERET